MIFYALYINFLFTYDDNKLHKKKYFTPEYQNFNNKLFLRGLKLFKEI
jgi:hypothetical protein